MGSQSPDSWGNRSWSGISKRFDPKEIDYLFVLVGDGRRWFIPGSSVEGSAAIMLGGQKYAEFEVEHGIPMAKSLQRSEAQ